MQELIQQIESLTNNPENRIEYKDVLDAIAPMQRSILPSALRTGESEGRFHRVVQWDEKAGKVSHFIVRGKRPDPVGGG